MLTVNEKPIPYKPDLLLSDLVRKYKPGANILLINGRFALPQEILKDGDSCTLIKEGQMPTVLEMSKTLAARHGQRTQQILSRSSVGVLGLGGLGSAVAVALVKMGIGKIVLCDHDVVDLSNIHRQHYFLDQIGQLKTKALKATLIRSNPFVAILTVNRVLTGADVPHLFAGLDVLVECFDDPLIKSATYQAVRKHLPDCGFVGSSGVAGFGSGESITVRQMDDKTYLVGDFVSDVEKVGCLTAARVGIAAHHQAHVTVRILLGQAGLQPESLVVS